MSNNDVLEKISFHSEAIDFELPAPQLIAQWLEQVIIQEKKSMDSLSIIFCSDEYLHKLNVDYLQHDTLTDVITFPYSSAGQPIHGDIFISIDRVRDNATAFDISFESELSRVMVHGVLHLAGYGDKTPEEAKIIRAKEDFYLSALSS